MVVKIFKHIMIKPAYHEQFISISLKVLDGKFSKNLLQNELPSGKTLYMNNLYTRYFNVIFMSIFAGLLKRNFYYAGHAHCLGYTYNLHSRN
jgi:hypothetical protein